MPWGVYPSGTPCIYCIHLSYTKSYTNRIMSFSCSIQYIKVVLLKYIYIIYFFVIELNTALIIIIIIRPLLTGFVFRPLIFQILNNNLNEKKLVCSLQTRVYACNRWTEEVQTNGNNDKKIYSVYKYNDYDFKIKNKLMSFGLKTLDFEVWRVQVQQTHV